MRPTWIQALAIALSVAFAAGAAAEELVYEVKGVNDPLKANVLAHVDTVQFGPRARLAEKDFPEVIADAETHAREALRPFGYYAPEVTGHLTRRDAGTLLLTLDIRKGPPLRVTETHINVVGEGAGLGALRAWRNQWSLGRGSVLDQAVWDQEKGRAIELAEADGYRSAQFTTQTLELDLERNQAVLRLTLDTGPQFVFGDVDYGEHVLKPGILEYIPRFRKGGPVSTRIMDRFRMDLWKTGYFTNVEIEETERTDTEPPQVDITVKLETSHRNTYQGEIGVGSDTGVRLQAHWNRHPMSSNGDRIDVGIGWQEKDDELTLRSNYRLPRLTHQRQYWVAELAVKIEKLDLEVKRRPEDSDFIKIAHGNVDDVQLRLGRLKVRNLKEGDRQLFGTPFVQFLNSDQRYRLLIPIPQLEDDQPGVLDINDDVYSVGYDADMVEVHGKQFDTVGRRERAWFFVSDSSFGSDVDFAQVYVGTRRVYRRGERWKLLVRGEVGYTDAQVDNLTITVKNEPVNLSVTQLPNFYRFKAGGSQSVRGYGFETLSNNDIGSNHIITASVEAEYRVLENWSVAAFFDVGNAFNNWSEPNLHKGVGIGLRWYSIAGPIRFDFAQALDFEGKPWRFHFTIGTPLL